MKKISNIILTLVLFLGLFSLTQSSWADSCGLLFDYHYYGGPDAYYIANANNRAGMQFSRTADFTLTKTRVSVGQLNPGTLYAYIYSDDGNNHMGSVVPGGTFTPLAHPVEYMTYPFPPHYLCPQIPSIGWFSRTIQAVHLLFVSLLKLAISVRPIILADTTQVMP